ncbi:ABC transporter substrate-binding protein [Haloferax gibbonsii]|uniref:Ferrichrome-binding protein n=1 Tax=Haloferax gibbonsii TaxID=35746 RepID=A0A0K1IUV8_HALGI|nr:ferrichrome-binding protein [Haloferax gibbonsii]
MPSDDNGRDGPTRRDYVKYGGAIIGGGLLAGCSQRDPAATQTETATETATPTATETATPEDTSYTVTMAPAGDVEFDAVPETWMAYYSNYGDMGIALGKLDSLQALVYREGWPLQFYDTLPGVDVSFDGVRQLSSGTFDKEVFYELDADVHLLDPHFVSLKHDGFSAADFDEIASNVGPVVGNYIRRHGQDWHDYEYYSLYEAFEKVAEVFHERERYEGIRSVHDTLIADIQANLPPESERPEIGLISSFSDFSGGSLDAYPIGAGNGKKQYQDLGIVDGFGPHIDGSYASWDYEQLLEADPDILVFPYGFASLSHSEFETRMDQLRDHPLGQQLTAVQNDRLYRGGTSYQGPILNLIQTEIVAKQFYPEQFGAWDGIETLHDEDAQLFDHQRVADIITGAES